MTENKRNTYGRIIEFCSGPEPSLDSQIFQDKFYLTRIKFWFSISLIWKVFGYYAIVVLTCLNTEP